MTRLIVPFAVLAVGSGCMIGEVVTYAEALQGAEQARLATSYEDLVTQPIEVTTDVTIGDRVEQAAADLAAFWQSQVPCSTVTTEGSVTTIDYGDLDDDCQWRGTTYGGTHALDVQRAGATIEVDHLWTGFTDGDMTADGGADVTWDLDARTREVVTDLTWTDDAHGATDVTGEHGYRLLDEAVGLLGGVVLDGTRAWDNDLGHWDLSMEGIELRWQDPAPQAGVYTLATPRGKSFTMTFTRVDDDTIEAVIEGTPKPVTVRLNPTGVEQTEE